MKTPWHIWVVGLVTLVWHAGGAYDYLMTKLKPEAYLQMIPEAQRADFTAYLAGMPVWATSAWALGVWGAVLGSLLILMRSRYAGSAFGVALLGLIVTNAYTYLVAPVAPMSGGMTLLFTAVILLVLIFALVYSRRQTAAGNLR